MKGKAAGASLVSEQTVQSFAAKTGRIHSFESGGMVDGPGLRFVVFLQGCPLRCQYCHNPDSIAFGKGREMTAAAVVAEARKYQTWMQTSGGGITLSGGEALSQPAFSLAIMKQAHRFGIHCALDTSGFGRLELIRPALDEADLVLLDIKSANPGRHRDITGVDMDMPRSTLEYLVDIRKKLWIRYVIVPGLTDDHGDLEMLLHLVKKIPNLEKFEFLPFHKMGESKWEDEGMEYRLADTAPPDPEYMAEIRSRFTREGIPS